MNLSLLDPFVLAQDCPEALVGSLHSGHSTSIRFNRRGDLLASGRSDGVVIVFDVETNGIARKLRGHTRQVQSLSWSADGRFLLSASQDWKCVLWDLENGSRVRTIRFEAPVFIAELHPQNHLLFVAALFQDQPMLVLASSEIPIKKTLPTAPRRPQLERENASERQLAQLVQELTQDAAQTTTVSIFSGSGDHILAGTDKGWLNIIETKTCNTLFSTRFTTSMIVLLRLTSSGRDLVMNSADRIIRTIRLPDLSDPKVNFDNFKLEIEHKFQDIVNRLAWNHATFSSSGEYVVASIFMNTDMYVWERRHGSLERILDGPKEELLNVEWHPRKPFIAACGADSGRVYLWSVVTPQKWSALAPDFAEVEENVDYNEREDEFDIHPIEEIYKRILHQEDEDIDVLTVEPVKKGFDEGDFQMPVIFDISDSDSDSDVVAIGTGQFRRKSPGQGKEWMIDDDASDQGTPRRPTPTASARSQSISKRRPAES